MGVGGYFMGIPRALPVGLHWDFEYGWKFDPEDCCFYLTGHPSLIFLDGLKFIPEPQGPASA
jgi:hypothetical protein